MHTVPYRVSPEPLSMPVGMYMRAQDPIAAETSILRAAELFREQGPGVVCVIENGLFAGAITEPDLARALGEGIDPLDSVDSILRRNALALPASTTGAEALRKLDETGEPALVVVDGNGRPIGSISASDLFSRRPSDLRPRMVGGMATPFGVYLTNGVLRAGAGNLALIMTGMVLFSMLVGADLIGTLLSGPLSKTSLSPIWQDNLLTAFVLGLFMVSMRLIPLSGTHAAEHMVVHAIERGEPLVPEVVRRMPRVHPRCGTNIAVGLSLFVGISNTHWIPDADLRLLVALLITVIAWQPLGSLVQYYVTTKPPTRKQLEAGIEVGKSLLAKYQNNPIWAGSVGRRLLNSGLPFIMLGGMLMTLIIQGLATIFGWQDFVKVY